MTLPLNSAAYLWTRDWKSLTNTQHLQREDTSEKPLWRCQILILSPSECKTFVLSIIHHPFHRQNCHIHKCQYFTAKAGCAEMWILNLAWMCCDVQCEPGRSWCHSKESESPILACCGAGRRLLCTASNASWEVTGTLRPPASHIGRNPSSPDRGQLARRKG